MNKAKVSVIMPVYNGALTVRLAIESIINQTYKDWELIVVDDCSNDSTPLILKEMAELDERIVIYRNSSNLGIAASLNVALGRSTHELIARMDADDYSLPNRFAAQVSFLESHLAVDILGTAIELVDNKGESLGCERRPERHEDIIALIYKEIPVFHPTVMMRKSFIRSVGGYDARRRSKADDLELWLRVYRKFRFHNLQEVHLRYCIPGKFRLSELAERTRVLVSAAWRNHENIVRWFYVGRYIIGGVILLTWNWFKL
jgi:glycosyltransferase involved in cell wall biosynthesis